MRNICLGILGSALVMASHASEISSSEPANIGYTEPYRIITVSAAETGVLAELLVKEGESVKQGQVLARLDTAMLAAELDIARAEARLQGMRKQRLDELAGSSRATPDELERTRTDLTIKEAQVRKAEAQIESRTLRSPVDGVVTEIKRDPSEAVSAAAPHVLTVVEIDRLAVNLFLPPGVAANLTPGTSTELVLLEENGSRVQGIVEYRSPVIDAASGTVRVKFVVENKDGKHQAGGRCALAEAR